MNVAKVSFEINLFLYKYTIKSQFTVELQIFISCTHNTNGLQLNYYRSLTFPMSK